MGSSLTLGLDAGLKWVAWGIWGGLGLAVVIGFGLVVFGRRGR